MSTAQQIAANNNIHYEFGGNDVKSGALDCSSFTQMVLGKVGMNIGRTTEDQWTNKNGDRVSTSNLQPGDLVFFKDTYEQDHTDGVSHVGIYVGNGQFINNNDDGVQTNSLSNSYWSKHYLGAKRFA